MDNIVIDNFDAVKKQLNFDTFGEFYFIQVVKRSKDNPDMTKKYSVKQAPTLVIIDGKDVTNVVNLSNIKKYIEEFKI